MIRLIEEIMSKKTIAEEVLYNLPEWFGIPSSTREYIEDSADMPFFAAFTEEGVAGFLALKENNNYTAEIFVMGIKKDYHRQGIGKDLFNACYTWCKNKGYEYLQVKTLDDSHPDVNYAVTRKYYYAMGFRPLECIPELWGKENPCLLMVQGIR